MTSKYLYTDGESIKNITLPQYPNEAWTFTSEAPEMAADELYATVAAVFRAANLNAQGVASLPFALVQENGEDYDTSEAWENKIGFMEDPKELIRLWRLSLFMYNQAYGFMERIDGSENLRYIVSKTINPIVTSEDGLIGFTRTVGTRKTDYQLGDDCPIFYIWRLDHTTELLPSPNSEFKALMSAAGVLWRADEHSRRFLKRGGIKPSILHVKGTPSADDRKLIEKAFDRLINNYYKYKAKVFNAETVEVQTIGEGLESFANDKFIQSKLEDIAMAAGIPLSLLLANSANRATAEIEYLLWFKQTVVPWAEFMAEVMNDQLFEPLGLRFEFRPENTDIGQEDETERATAYATYIGTGMLPSVAAQTLGIELPANVEYEDLDKMVIVEEQEPAEVEDVIDIRSFTPSLEQYAEMKLWQEFAFRKYKRGDSLEFKFEVKTLPDEIADIIRDRLAGAEGEDGIKAAYTLDGLPEVEQVDPAMLKLAEAINRAVDTMEVEDGNQS